MVTAERMATLLGWGALALLAAISYVIANFDRLPLHEALVEKLKVGMTSEECDAMLPEPTHVRDGGHEWVYTRTLSWPIITLHFADNGRLAEVVVDR